MKHSQFITGFLSAACLFLLTGAGSHRSQAEELPRYHLAFSTSGFNEAVVYDAISGEVEFIQLKKINDDSNLKSLLENK